MKKIIIIKASGEKQPFDVEKYKNSLRRSGATEDIVEDVIKKIEPKMYDGMTTKELYKLTRAILKFEKRPAVTGRYHLKQAIYALGPSGLPFERYLGRVFEKQGYKVVVGKVLAGKCSSKHETDIIAEKGDERILVECKFHNRPGLNSTVQTALYVKARFDDIVNKYNKAPDKYPCNVCWIITNTRFTSSALEYGECSGIKMISWSHPKNNSLKSMIDSKGLHPITCLSSLTKKEQQHLLRKGVVLCCDLKKSIGVLRHLKVSEAKVSKALEECDAICRGK